MRRSVLVKRLIAQVLKAGVRAGAVEGAVVGETEGFRVCGGVAKNGLKAGSSLDLGMTNKKKGRGRYFRD
jgi:uncharacterized membrane protein